MALFDIVLCCIWRLEKGYLVFDDPGWASSWNHNAEIFAFGSGAFRAMYVADVAFKT